MSTRPPETFWPRAWKCVQNSGKGAASTNVATPLSSSPPSWHWMPPGLVPLAGRQRPSGRGYAGGPGRGADRYRTADRRTEAGGSRTRAHARSRPDATGWDLIPDLSQRQQGGSDVQATPVDARGRGGRWRVHGRQERGPALGGAATAGRGAEPAHRRSRTATGATGAIPAGAISAGPGPAPGSILTHV